MRQTDGQDRVYLERPPRSIAHVAAHAAPGAETGSPFAGSPRRLLNAGAVLQLQGMVGNQATRRILAIASAPASGRPPASARPAPTIQREMKFEFQTSNEIFRADGTEEELLQRKFGPKDFLVEGASGVRLESETNGVLEFETGWAQWPKLQSQIAEAFDMTKKMDAAADVTPGRKAFPFDIDHLKQGTRREMQRRHWDPKKDKENKHERILGASESLQVNISDSTWNAGIQASEEFLLSQYESYLKEHEFPAYREPVIASAETILLRVKPASMPIADLANLNNFLEILVNYVKRGQGGPESAAAGSFEDVEGMPSKQAFGLMSRTNFASMHGSLLSKKERRLFRKIVRGNMILTEMGMDRTTPMFIKGYGKDNPQVGPTVHQWLSGITKGKDLLSTQTGPGLSNAMGRFNVEKKKGRKNTGLIRFEARTSTTGVHADAKDWETFAHERFLRAEGSRKRTGKTALRP